MFKGVEDTGSKLPALPTTRGTLAHFTEAIGRGKSVEGRGTGVGRSGHEENWCRK